MPSSSISTSASIVGVGGWTGGGGALVIGLHSLLAMGIGEDPLFIVGAGTGTSAQARP